MSRRTWAAFAVVGILWGSAWIVAPMLPVPDLAAGAARFAIAATILAVAAWVFRARQKTSAPLVPSLLLGITMIGVPYALAVWAKGSVSIGVVAVLYALTPLAALFFSRDSSAAPIPALAIGMGGVAFLVAQGIQYSLGQVKGASLLIVAVVLAGFSLNYAKRHIRKDTVLVSSAIQCAVACVLLGCVSAITGQLHFVGWNWESVSLLGAVAAVEGAIALPMLYWLLNMVEPWQAGMLQWVSTLVAVVEAAWFLRAKPTMQMIAGAVIIAGTTIWLIRRDEAGNFPDNKLD